jgi:hypothetical protein
MTVLEIHDNECFKLAKGVLKTNIDTPVLAKTKSDNGVNYIIFIDGEKLAENLELKVKNSLKKSDLSDKYLLELDFDNLNLQNDNLFFGKIIESAVFYEVPESLSETKEDLNWFKKVIYEDGYSKEELRKNFGIGEVNPKLYMEFLDLTIASLIVVETIFQRRTTNVEVGRIQQCILPHERGYEPPVEISEHYVTRHFEQKLPVQMLSTKTTTMTETLSERYTCNNFFGDIILNLIHREKEHVIEYQTIAKLTAEQYSFVLFAKRIVEAVDEYIRRFRKLYYTEEELKELGNLSHESIETVYLIEFYGSDQDNSNRLVKAERLKKILADGSLLGQKEEIELKQTSKGLEVKDTDIERLERTYQGQGLFINAVPLEY